MWGRRATQRLTVDGSARGRAHRCAAERAARRGVPRRRRVRRRRRNRRHWRPRRRPGRRRVPASACAAAAAGCRRSLRRGLLRLRLQRPRALLEFLHQLPLPRLRRLPRLVQSFIRCGADLRQLPLVLSRQLREAALERRQLRPKRAELSLKLGDLKPRALLHLGARLLRLLPPVGRLGLRGLRARHRVGRGDGHVHRARADHGAQLGKRRRHAAVARQRRVQRRG